jgi:hypothetical protein
MAQIFRPSSNSLARATIVGLILLVVGTLWLLAAVSRSSYVTQQNVVVDQPVPFSHEHHVNGLGIDCRYCHTSVEESSFAGMPPTETCMTCHSQVWTNARMLEPVRESFRSGRPLRWNRVHDLPDFVYFNHAIHVAKGVGCESCHGRVDRMPLPYRAATLEMVWCLECHRQPEAFLRPRNQVVTMGYKPAGDQLTIGSRLVTEHKVNVKQLTDCSICHR